ncbi:MAG TPA: glycosyltransferase family 2 protein [Candidatus Eremiobacteraeota bacterium]|nr:MAG: Glycosyl transferase family 2 [bacterium ADurb.Bin363]HPZ07902.1 glycosyltransferase family 2 protein [Candidatus Eremiobacteraeota bacterium]
MELAFILLAVSVSLFNLWLCLKSLLYSKIIFTRFYSTRYDNNYNPKVAVFVPCKGADNNLKIHLNAIATQNYINYRVTFIVDSVLDPAVEVINRITALYPHTKLLVAGKATTCGQKNHNLLRGIEDDNNESEVYLFADSDVQPHINWLKELIRPLSLESVPVTTGFRWLIPEDNSVSGSLHSMMSAYLCMLIAHQTFRGVWGGSTAIKRKDFEKLNVKELWETSVVDDMTLTRLLFKKRINRVFVPTCLTVSYNTLSRLTDDIQWYSRQAAFLKAYLKPLWIACIVLHALTIGISCSTPVFVLISLLWFPVYKYAIIASLFSLVQMICYGMMKFIYKDNQRFIKWFLYAPLMQVLGFYSLIKPGFSNNIEWRNICYELHRDGRVKSIRELPEKVEIS